MVKQTSKRLVAICSIAVLLFAQFAAASYACTGIGGAAAAFVAASDDAIMAAMPGCEMGKGTKSGSGINPNLCLQHCQAGDQSVQTLPHIPVPALAVIPRSAVLEPVFTPAGCAVQFTTAWTVQVPLPPPLVRFGVLRI